MINYNWDMYFVTLFVFLAFVLGCAGRRKGPEYMSSLDDYRFEKTMEAAPVVKSQSTVPVTVRLQDVSFSQAMRLISDLTAVPIIWGTSLDAQPVTASFDDVPLGSVLETLARRVGASVSEVGGVYYVGELRRDDTVSAVLRMVPVDPGELQTALDRVTTEYGVVSILGSTIWISDRLETVRKMVQDIESLRERSQRSYVAEVFFLRLREDDFVKVTGDLRVNSIDVFASSFNMDNLFSMFLDASGKAANVVIDQRPTMYLSEGRESKFEVGSEIIRERKAVVKEGIIETVGYEKFNDGIDLALKLSRISDQNYMLDVKLSVSIFDTTDKSGIPALNKSVLSSPGLLVQDGRVYYVGSLRKRETKRVLHLFGIDTGKETDLLTIWVRVREVKNG